MATDLNDIETQIAELQKKRQSLLDEREKEREVKLGEIKAAIEQFGFTATDLGFVVEKRKKVTVAGGSLLEAKYRDPNDPAKTWHGGKGPRPAWLKEFLDSGGKLEEIKIVKAASQSGDAQMSELAPVRTAAGN